MNTPHDLARSVQPGQPIDESIDDRLRIAASVFAHSREGILIADAGGFIADVNPAFERITGYARHEVLGRSPKMLGAGRHAPEFFRAMWATVEQHGTWSGQVINRRKNGEVYAELLTIREVRDPAGQISHYIGSFIDLSNLYADEDVVDRVIHNDALTGLPNRRLFLDRLRHFLQNSRVEEEAKQATSHPRLAVVCLIDLDDFAAINRRHSLAGGDAALIEMARRIRSCLQADENEVLARLEGDTFAILFAVDRLQACDERLQSLRAAISRPLAIGSASEVITARLGVAIADTESGSAEALLEQARQALQQACREAPDTCRLFDPAHDQCMRDHHQLCRELATALQAGGLVIHYLPKVDMTTSRVIGAEALVRWPHTTRGMLLPEDFLYAAAAAGLELDLGEWVIRTVVEQLGRWQASGLRLSLTLNLSARQFLDVRFPQRLQSILARHPGLWVQDLVFDLTGDTLSANGAEALQLEESMATCRRLGIRLALDDFGSEDLSLRFLTTPVTEILKLDPSLSRHVARDPRCVATLEGIIKIALAFGHEVVAEGVENVEQGAWLIHLGCRQAQGRAITPPLPAEAFAAWMDSWQGNPTWMSMAGLPIGHEDMPLVVAEAWLHQWVDAFVEDIRRGATADSSSPDSVSPKSVSPDSVTLAQSNFARWLNDSGHARHGHLDVYRRAESYYHALNSLSQDIQQMSLQDPARAASRLGNVVDLRDRLIETIGELVGELLINSG